jgi:hypothetical protein
MGLFQIVALAFTAVMLVVSVRSLLRARSRPLPSIFWLLIWSAAGVALTMPNATTRVAQGLGIRRGADLVLYSTTLGFLVGSYLVYLKVRQLTREITVLTRQLAILEAQQTNAPERHAPSSAARD